MLAAKFHDDLFYNNAYYSKLGTINQTPHSYVSQRRPNAYDLLSLLQAAYR